MLPILTILFELLHLAIAPDTPTYLDIVSGATIATAFYAPVPWFLVLEKQHREALLGRLGRVSQRRK